MGYGTITHGIAISMGFHGNVNSLYFLEVQLKNVPAVFVLQKIKSERFFFFSVFTIFFLLQKDGEGGADKLISLHFLFLPVLGELTNCLYRSCLKFPWKTLWNYPWVSIVPWKFVPWKISMERLFHSQA